MIFIFESPVPVVIDGKKQTVVKAVAGSESAARSLLSAKFGHMRDAGGKLIDVNSFKFLESVPYECVSAKSPAATEKCWWPTEVPKPPPSLLLRRAEMHDAAARDALEKARTSLAERRDAMKGDAIESAATQYFWTDVAALHQRAAADLRMQYLGMTTLNERLGLTA